MNELEQLILNTLTNPQLEPQFGLWRQVRYKSGKKYAQGRIIGFYWYSVSYAFENDYYPGWQYLIESGTDHKNVIESDIEPLDSDGTTPIASFQLWQQVEFSHEGDRAIGQIVGLEYVPHPPDNQPAWGYRIRMQDDYLFVWEFDVYQVMGEAQ